MRLGSAIARSLTIALPVAARRQWRAKEYPPYSSCRLEICLDVGVGELPTQPSGRGIVLLR